MTEAVAAALTEALLAADGGGATIRDLLSRLRDDTSTARIPRRAVEDVLEDDDRFVPDRDAADPKVRWRLTDEAASAYGRAVGVTAAAGGLAPPVDPGRPLDGLDLLDWQVEAFGAWAAAGTRGVVEAVTGTGKTRLAVAAVRATLARGGRALVLVPTLDLQDQWVAELRRFVPAARVGRLGGGGDADLHGNHVVVATPHSAAAVPVDLPHDTVGLLVADEAHRYGAPTWAAALKPVFTMRLALTATYERPDDGVVDVLGPYFGGVVLSYGYDRAVPDGVIAPFRVAFVGTELEEAERASYDALDARVRQLHAELIGTHRLPRDPRRLFREAAVIVADGAGEGTAGQPDPRLQACREYLARVRARRDVAATAAGKLDVLTKLAPALRSRADRSLVFCDTVEQAETAARLLRGRGLAAETVHGGLTDDRRRIRLAQFRRGNLDVVVAPRVLDEGVDVPEADVAVVLAAFRTRRQMVQRLGRVLRRKPDGRHAHLLVAYAIATREDPDQGAHREFIDDVLPVATEVARLDADADPDGLVGWLDRTATARA